MRGPVQAAYAGIGDDSKEEPPCWKWDGMRQGRTVAQLAAEVAVQPDTVRFYEKAGLLPAPERTTAGYSSYDETAVDRLRFILGAKRLRLRLDEIKTLLDVRDTGACPCEPAAPLLRRHIAEIDAEMARLSALRVELARMADALPSDDCPFPAPGTWRPATPR